MRDRRILLLANWVRYGRCHDCRQPVEWRMTGKGKKMPFNKRPLVLSRHEDPDTTVRYEFVSSEELHFASCRCRPARRGGFVRGKWEASSR